MSNTHNTIVYIMEETRHKTTKTKGTLNNLPTSTPPERLTDYLRTKEIVKELVSESECFGAGFRGVRESLAMTEKESGKHPPAPHSLF